MTHPGRGAAGTTRQVWILLILTLTVCGCRHAQRSYTYRTAILTSENRARTARIANARGLSHAQSGDYALAEEGFREALAADVGLASAHNNLGAVLLERGRYYESALEFSFAADLDGCATEPLINLGRLYETIGWHEAAIREYEKALDIEPNDAEALGRLAQARIRIGKAPAGVTPVIKALATRQHEDRRNKLSLVQKECGATDSEVEH